MKPGIAAALGAIFATSAWAQTPAPPLDLKVPPNQSASVATAPAAKAADEPGKYYGDVGGNGDAVSDTHVSGSVSTGIGYSKAFGTGFSNAADLNVSKQYGDGKVIDFHIGVSQSNGFPNRWQRGYGGGYTDF
ncbi:MAG: hypothetical protein ABI082_01405 [Dokdonella sp.]